MWKGGVSARGVSHGVGAAASAWACFRETSVAIIAR